MNAKFLTLGQADFIKGFIVTVISTILSGVIVGMNAGAIPTIHQLHIVALSGLSAGLGYIVKNLLTNSKNQFLKGERSNASDSIGSGDNPGGSTADNCGSGGPHV